MINGLARRARMHWAVPLAGIAGLGAGALATRAVAGDIADRAGIERIVHDYILAHPEIIPEAMTKLQDRQAAAAIGDARTALETPFAGAWAGNPKGTVTLVMFTDYSCGFCKATVPQIDRLLAEQPDLKVVWREIPILGPQSVAAARAALVAAKQGRYLPFHHGLYAAGHPDAATIAVVAHMTRIDPASFADGIRTPDVDRELDANLKLAGRLGVDGTPAFVIGGKMLSGAVGYEALKQAIADTRKS